MRNLAVPIVAVDQIAQTWVTMYIAYTIQIFESWRSFSTFENIQEESKGLPCVTYPSDLKNRLWSVNMDGECRGTPYSVYRILRCCFVVYPLNSGGERRLSELPGMRGEPVSEAVVAR